MNNKFKKIIFLEGLPNVGKTTIVNYMKKNYQNIIVSDEIMNENILNDYLNISQEEYLQNDKIKFYRTANDDIDILLIDRGFISTYCYNIVNAIIQNNYSSINVIKELGDMLQIYQQNNVEVIYLKSDDYSLPYLNLFDPYGSVENQKLLQEITLYICNKYVKNLKIINYNYSINFEEVIHEIIN